MLLLSLKDCQLNMFVSTTVLLTHLIPFTFTFVKYKLSYCSVASIASYLLIQLENHSSIESTQTFCRVKFTQKS